MSLVREIELNKLGDNRGNLVAIEGDKTIPFTIKRVYYIYGCGPATQRGFHAHKALKQIAVCVAGSCTMLLDDGRTQEKVLMESPSRGILIDHLVWREMRDFSKDCVLLVLASEHYDESDYIRDYDDFLRLAKQVTQ